MVRAFKQIVTIQPGGRVEVSSDELPAGQSAEVIVLVNQDPVSKRYDALFGCGQGAYSSPGEADAFLRSERDAWEC